MMALKQFLMNKIYNLRQGLAQIQSKEKQLKKDQSKNKRCIKNLEMKLQNFQKQNQILRDENIGKRSILDTVLNQNNKLLNLIQISIKSRKISKAKLSHESSKKCISKIQ